MLAEGIHAGLEAKVVRIQNGDVEGCRTSFLEHQIEHSTRTEADEEIAVSTCFLEIEEEQDFAIVVSLNPPITDICSDDWFLETFVDGRLISADVKYAFGGTEDNVYIDQMPLKIGKKRMAGNLKFAKLVTTDVAADVHLNVSENDIGTIQIRITAGEILKECRSYTELHLPDIGIADEAKSKRTGSVVVPSKVYQAPKRDKLFTWESRPDGKFSHEFIFNYRTKLVLEVLDVVPKPISAIATLVSDGLASIGPEVKEEPELEARVSGAHDVQQELLAEVRAMRMSDMKKDMRRIQASTSRKAEFIDLTGDDSDEG